jgi:hypothetical protein
MKTLKTNLKLLFFLILGFIHPIFSQDAQVQELFKRNGYCSYLGDNSSKNQLSVTNPDSISVDAVDLILRYTGIKKNFTIKQSTDIPNAEASIDGELRYVIYNQVFLDRIKLVSNNKWAATSIMAHELGHHLQGHTLGSGGSSPDLELEADKYSGFILQRMGASLIDSQSAMKVVATTLGSGTHPGKMARLSAISNGWKEALGLSIPKSHGKEADKDRFVVKEFDENKTVEGKSIKRSFAAAEDPNINGKIKEDKISYVARIVFDDEIEDENFITNSNEIVSFNDFEQTVVVGYVLDSDNDNYVYMFNLNHKDYYVDEEGDIFAEVEEGKWEDIGYVADDE